MSSTTQAKSIGSRSARSLCYAGTRGSMASARCASESRIATRHGRPSSLQPEALPWCRIPGLADARPWTNREATTAREVPKRLIVLGGGPVGVEMAQAYSELGSRVCILESAPRLLSREEEFAGAELQSALGNAGVEIHLGTEVAAVARRGATVTVTLADGLRIHSDELLVAVGRRPLTEDLGLETVGLEPGSTIDVDDTLRVPTLPWLYAVGDVNGRKLLTHAGKYQAHVVATTIDGGTARATSDTRGVPRVTFTDPQVAATGLTLAEALEHGLDAHAYDVPSSDTAGASFHGRGAPGTARIVVDEARGIIVGATFTGAEVAEWLYAATIAVTAEIPVEHLWDAIPVFPTRSEVWLKLLERRESTRGSGVPAG